MPVDCLQNRLSFVIQLVQLAKPVGVSRYFLSLNALSSMLKPLDSYALITWKPGSWLWTSKTPISRLHCTWYIGRTLHKRCEYFRIVPSGLAASERLILGRSSLPPPRRSHHDSFAVGSRHANTTIRWSMERITMTRKPSPIWVLKH